MGTADYCLIVVVVLFCAFGWALHSEDRRQFDRRQNQDPPGTILDDTRRSPDRRKHAFLPRLKWMLRSLLKKVSF